MNASPPATSFTDTRWCLYFYKPLSIVPTLVLTINSPDDFFEALTTIPKPSELEVGGMYEWRPPQSRTSTTAVLETYLHHHHASTFSDQMCPNVHDAEFNAVVFSYIQQMVVSPLLPLPTIYYIVPGVCIRKYTSSTCDVGPLSLNASWKTRERKIHVGDVLPPITVTLLDACGRTVVVPELYPEVTILLARPYTGQIHGTLTKAFTNSSNGHIVFDDLTLTAVGETMFVFSSSCSQVDSCDDQNNEPLDDLCLTAHVLPFYCAPLSPIKNPKGSSTTRSALMELDPNALPFVPPDVKVEETKVVGTVTYKHGRPQYKN